MSKRGRWQPDEFTIGWICALPLEVDAARAVLEEEYEDNEQAASYILGRIGSHNVVIACPPAGHIGTGAAAVTAQRLNHTFPTIRYNLLVGIGGGVPSETTDIRLGDVVISKPQGAYGGVVQYDFGKTTSGGQRVYNGHLNAPPQDLLAATTKLMSNLKFGRSRFNSDLERLVQNPLFPRPPPDIDILFDASCAHVVGVDCEKCCSDKVVNRPERSVHDSVVHCGLIGSGNQVMRDAVARDTISRELGGVLCFEMEAAGLMNNFSCLVVRGICDYADAHKNKHWQPFAAIAAAACAKELLLGVAPVSAANIEGSTAFIALQSRSTTLSNTYDDGIDNPRAVPPSLQQRGHATLTRNTLSDEQRHRYFASLYFNLIESRYLTVRKAHAKTCGWLVERAEFKEWLDSSKLNDHFGFLWMKGKAATGKSTIMKFVLSHFKRSDKNDIIIAFFFNARGETLEKTALGMYRSLLYQLLEQRSDLHSIFDSRLTEPDQYGSVPWTLEQLQILMRLAVEKLGNSSVICLIDALDECDDDEVQQMVKFFCELSASAIEEAVEFRVMFSSRHYPNIIIDQGISLVLEKQTEHNEDIVKYVETELKGPRTKKLQVIREEIRRRSSGIFLWVVLVVDILNKEFSKGKVAAMEERLKIVPGDIKQLFNDILQRGTPCSAETVSCLQWVLYAKTPLAVEELYFAILSGLQPPEVTIWDEDEIDESTMETYVLEASRGLVELTKVKSKTVQFIHESVRQFFLDGQILEKSPFSPAGTFPQRSHEHLKTCCWNYVNSRPAIDLFVSTVPVTMPPRNSVPDDISRSKMLQKMPFLRYAVDNILYHCDYADSLGLSQASFVQTFNVAHWISMNDMLERYKIRRYDTKTPLIYLAADQDLPYLAQICLSSASEMAPVPLEAKILLLAGLGSNNGCDMTAILSHVLSSRLDTQLFPAKLTLSEPGIRRGIKMLRDFQYVKKRGGPELTRWAIHHGFNGVTLIEMAISCQNLEDLARTGAENAWMPMFQAARVENNILLMRMLFYLHQGSTKGRAILHKRFLELASRLNDDKELIKLFQLQPNVMYSSPFVTTFDIDNSAKNGNAEMVRLLVISSILSESYNTPKCLAIAARYGVDEVYETFLSQTNDQSRLQSLLDLVCTNSCDEGCVLRIVGLALARCREDVDLTGTVHSLLWRAVYQRHARVVELILSPGDFLSNVSVCFPYAETHLWQNEHSKFVKLLTRHVSIDINQEDSNGYTMLHHAVVWDQSDLVKLLLKQPKLDVNQRTRSGNTSLYLATIGIRKITEALLTHPDIDVNVMNDGKVTPLIRACENRNTSVARLLCDHPEIRVNIRDCNGRSALSWAQERGLSEIEAILKAKGAE